MTVSFPVGLIKIWRDGKTSTPGKCLTYLPALNINGEKLRFPTNNIKSNHIIFIPVSLVFKIHTL